jgi:hypothetical protein
LNWRCLPFPTKVVDGGGHVRRSVNKGEVSMRLNAPTQVVFIISLIIAVLAVIGHFVMVPFVTEFKFWFAMVAYIVLAAACVLKGV